MGKLDNVFYKLPARLAQAEKVSKIHNHKEVFLDIDLNHKVIYSYLLTTFKYNRMKGKPTFAGMEYLALKCGISLSTVKRKVRDLKEFGIITYITGRSMAGFNTPCEYTEIVDLISDNRFKLHNPKLNAFFKDKALKALYIRDLFSEHPIDKSWTPKQAKFFWINKHYELMTGLYLTGDKTSKVLYESCVGFKMEDSLKDEDFKLLFELRLEELEADEHKTVHNEV